jgi:uncharacterized protein
MRRMILGVVSGVQVPGVAAVAHLTGSWPLAVGGAALITLPYLAGLKNPFEDRPKGRLLLYAGLWPFFAWWTSCLAFAALAPLALVAAWLIPLPLDHALLAGGGIALVGGIGATRRTPRLVRRTVHIRGLPRALDGYRVAHISDIHCGSYTPPSRVQRWMDMINRLQPDLVAVTGDLIVSGDRYTEAVAEVLGTLRARDGVFACMGNHDYFTDGEAFAQRLSRHGLIVLRNRGERVRGLWVAGVDDTWTRRNDMARALAERPDGAPAILLAHDPNLFPEAVERGVALTLSGHTHGGQLAVPGLSRRLNLARLITAFTAGLYRIGDATLYVSRGAGTTGPPVRLGARAEIAILTLRCE